MALILLKKCVDLLPTFSQPAQLSSISQRVIDAFFVVDKPLRSLFCDFAVKYVVKGTNLLEESGQHFLRLVHVGLLEISNLASISSMMRGSNPRQSDALCRQRPVLLLLPQCPARGHESAAK